MTSMAGAVPPTPVVADPGGEPPPAAAGGTNDRFALLDRFLRRTRYAQDQLIEALHVAQDLDGHLSDEVLAHLAEALQLPPSRVYGVATFYHLFVFEPPGQHTCTLCTGTACFVKGADAIVEALQTTYGVTPGGVSDDGRLGLATARCLGSCGLAPVMVLDGEVRGHQTVEQALATIADVLDGDAAAEEDG